MKATEMVAQLREARPGIAIIVRCGRRGSAWQATCRAGFENGAYPLWQRREANRDEAIRRAIYDAWHHWVARHRPA